jgi:hypothetical protein
MSKEPNFDDVVAKYKDCTPKPLPALVDGVIPGAEQWFEEWILHDIAHAQTHVLGLELKTPRRLNERWLDIYRVFPPYIADGVLFIVDDKRYVITAAPYVKTIGGKLQFCPILHSSIFGGMRPRDLNAGFRHFAHCLAARLEATCVALNVDEYFLKGIKSLDYDEDTTYVYEEITPYAIRAHAAEIAQTTATAPAAAPTVTPTEQKSDECRCSSAAKITDDATKRYDKCIAALDYEGAEIVATEMITNAPNVHSGYLARANVRMLMRKLVGAIADYREVERLDPSFDAAAKIRECESRKLKRGDA